MEEYLLFLKYNDKEIRKHVATDFHTEQDVELVIYNVDSLIRNYIKATEVIYGKR